MRLYTFTNFMLSSIQQGIQSSHVISDLFIKYTNELHDIHTPDAVLYDWAKTHKTMICLNGGNNEALENLYYANLVPIGTSLGLPHTEFHEDEQSLGGIMTCCGIVVPAYIYESAQTVRGQDPISRQCMVAPMETAAWELVDLLNQFGLAR